MSSFIGVVAFAFIAGRASIPRALLPGAPLQAEVAE
jgi:hypothetical protein